MMHGTMLLHMSAAFQQAMTATEKPQLTDRVKGQRSNTLFEMRLAWLILGSDHPHSVLKNECPR